MRVLALTRNASLLVALGSMMREWEVVSVRDVASALESEPGSVVALIDLGDTLEGLEAATELYNHGITIPVVILGDEPSEASGATILVRPFSLDDLASTVRDASTKQPSGPPRSGRVAAEPPLVPNSRVDAQSGATAAAPKPQTDSASEPEKKPTKNRPLSVVPPVEPEAPSKPAPSTPKPASAEERREAELREAKRAEAERRDLRRAEAQQKDAERREAKRLEIERRDAEHRESARLEAERRRAERLEAERAAAPQGEPQSQPDPEVVELPAAAVPAPEPHGQAPRPQPQTVAASAATEPAQLESEPARRRLRRRGSRPQTVSEEELESPLVRRLKRATEYTAELEALIEELPFVADLSSMADGFISEVESQFSAQVASVFVRRTDGYHVIAHRGLSRVESGMVVPETQPLISDVLQTGEGILIQPVDLAQGLVAGIGGARTEAIMAVPAVVHGACVAIVMVGRDHFTEDDLDSLSDLAGEAAPGLAVSLALARLRERI